jgi:putative transposase
MPRLARSVFPGVPHHITQRGNRREDNFFTDGDRHTYLSWLREYSEEHQVDVLAYCLMTNHYSFGRCSKHRRGIKSST